MRARSIPLVLAVVLLSACAPDLPVDPVPPGTATATLSVPDGSEVGSLEDVLPSDAEQRPVVEAASAFALTYLNRPAPGSSASDHSRWAANLTPYSSPDLTTTLLATPWTELADGRVTTTQDVTLTSMGESATASVTAQVTWPDQSVRATTLTLELAPDADGTWVVTTLTEESS